MVGQEESALSKSPEFLLLPTMVRHAIPEMFGPHMTKRELFVGDAPYALHDRMVAELDKGISAPRLEAVSFAEWLRRPTLKNFTDPLTPEMAERGSYPGNDCLAISDRVIDLVKKSRIGRHLTFAERVKFIRPGHGEGDPVQVQNMALFRLGGDGTGNYLVDTAAFFYNNAWSRAWQGPTVRSLFDAGRYWLEQGEGMGPWEDTYPMYEKRFR